MLEEDVQYWWIVYTIDAEDSNREIIVAQGGIEWIDPHLVQYYGHSCNPEEVRLGLEAGIWYDAFACLNKLMEANPEDDELGELRTRLLRDGGITGR